MLVQGEVVNKPYPELSAVQVRFPRMLAPTVSVLLMQQVGVYPLRRLLGLLEPPSIDHLLS